MDVSNKTTLGNVKLVMLKGEQGETGRGALVANTVADMVDITQIYVYTGSETGYTFGNWYYWSGSAWTSGGVYNSTALGAEVPTNQGALSSGSFNDVSAVNGFWLLATAFAYTDVPPQLDGIRFAGMLMQIKSPTTQTRSQVLVADKYGIYHRMKLGETWDTWKDATNIDNVYKNLGDIGSETDANNIVNDGVYWTSENRLANFPFVAGWLFVSSTSAGSLSQIKLQIAISRPTQEIKIRTRNISGNWSEYRDVTTNEIVDYDFLYTEFERIRGWYKEDGTIVETSIIGNPLYRTNNIAVRPLQELYTMMYSIVPQSCGGAFFDSAGNWLAPIMFSGSNPAAVLHDYPKTNVTPNDTSLDYAPLYKITVPNGAYYMCMNIPNSGTNPTYKRVESISSLPIIGASNTGNKIWRKDDPMRAAKKGKKLYIIGQSTVAIDRAFRTIYDAATGTTETGSQPIVGWQEYLMPYYDSVVSLGFSGIGYRYDENASDTRSVYKYITDGTYTGYADNNLADADEVIILVGTNNTSVSQIGTYTDTDVSTFCGAVNSLIDHIYNINSGENASNPHPVIIYIQTYEDKREPNDTSWAVVRQANEQARLIANARKIPLIDNENDSGINYHNAALFSYDSNVFPPYGMHLNYEGNRVRGNFTLKSLI